MNAHTPAGRLIGPAWPAAAAALVVAAAALVASFVSAAQTPQPRNRKARPGFEFSAKRGDVETKIRMYFERGVLKKITATDAGGTRTLKTVKPGGRLAQPCAAAERTCETFKLEGGGTYKACACKSEELMALLVPAPQWIREAAGDIGGGGGGGGDGGGGGAFCTPQKPCCYEDEKLQMSICHPSL